MAINFTDSPADGATQVISGRTYTYNSAKNKWDTTATEVAGPTATVYATVNDLPGSATAGDQAFVSGTNRLYIWNGSGWYNIALINTTPSISGASASYDLASDGTPTVVTITASDPEELPITYSIASDTSGNIATVTQNANVFTITPSTNTAGTFSLTFRASDGVNIATAVSEFTLEFIVENSNYTTALITSVGANNAVNNSFTDSSSNSHTITANGNVTQNTFSPYRHGGYSTYFDGSGDYIRYDDASLAEGTGDFTVEFWVRRDGNQSLNDTIVGHDATPGWQICFNSDGSTIRWMTNATDASRVLPASLNDQQWHHVVYQRDSGTLQGFLDGVSLGTVSLTTNFTNQRIEIGVNRGGTAYFTGNVRDVRIIKGTAFYSSSGFNVPTEPLTAVSGTGYSTTLLSCHLPYIADGGANSLSPTVNGNTRTEPVAPYDYLTYTSGDHGGSVYFDGTGDYLLLPSSTSSLYLSGAFTYECWIYPVSTGGNQIYGNWNAQTGNAWGFFYHTTGAFSSALKVYFYRGNYGTNEAAIGSTTGLTLNTWNHFAVTRDSNNNIYMFINGQSLSLTTHGANGLTWDSSYSFTNSDSIGIGGTSNYSSFNGNITNARFVSGTALYTSDFTPPTAPLTAIGNTQLLLSGTNAGIIDKSQSVKTITLNGDVKSSTTQSKYLTSSMYFDGNDYLNVDDFRAFASGEDWTIESWVWLDFSQTRETLINFIPHTTRVISLNRTGSGDTYIFLGNGSSWIGSPAITSSSNLSSQTWHHVALVNNSGTITLYHDGTSVGSTTTQPSGFNGGYNLGAITGYTTERLKGYLSDFRISQGLARYTANFTPPTTELKG